MDPSEFTLALYSLNIIRFALLTWYDIQIQAIRVTNTLSSWKFINKIKLEFVNHTTLFQQVDNANWTLDLNTKNSNL